MRPLVTKLTPSRGISQILHIGLNLLLPILVYLLVRTNFIQLAFSLILLSKWRMFAVRPRFWLANIRANAIDIIIGLSVLAFMTDTDLLGYQLLWTVLWGGWLIFIKPRTTAFWVSLQALIGFAVGLSAIFLVLRQAALVWLVISVGLLCYVAGHHFFDSFDEPYTRLLSFTGAYFGAALTWVLGHWLLYYGVVAQPTLLLTALGVGLGSLYYLDHYDRLAVQLQRQITFIMLAVVVVVLVFSDWGNKII